MKSFPDALLNGYRNFMSGRYADERDRYRRLAEAGQKPKALIIACCDSRAAPETIFDAGPGELFVVRNIANIVRPYAEEGETQGTAAALEFAVQALEVKDIVVMGHGRCGGIQFALDAEAKPLSPGNSVGRWISQLEPLAEEMQRYTTLTAAERQTALERISVRNSIENLRTFPYVKEREDKGELSLHGAWFDISTGELWIMDRESGDFKRPDV